MKKTKIVASIGPSSRNMEVLRELILNGMDIARINMAYADYNFAKDIIEKINTLNKELNTNVSIMLDLKGPSVTVGKFKGGSAYLNKGDKIRIYKDDIIGDSTKFSVSYSNLISKVKTNTTIKINNGLLELNVDSKQDDCIICEVIHGGFIEDGNGVNVIDIELDIPFLSDKDRQDIEFAVKNKVDFISLSKVANAENVLDVNDILIELKDDHIGVVAKIETESAVLEIDEIIKNSDAILVARGDLGVVLPMERIPGIQKAIINKCHTAGKISIVSTELMSSMEDQIRPTRAEVSDVANAILDGVDVVMLSGETTIGKYPVETLEAMTKVIKSSEKEQNYYDFLDVTMRSEKQDITGSVAYSAVESALRLKCDAIITPTISGYTARKISRYRPSCVVIALCPNIEVAKNLNMYYGIYPVIVDEIKSFDKMMDLSKKYAKKILKLEEAKIIITGGYPFKEVKHTNFMKIEEI